MSICSCSIRRPRCGRGLPTRRIRSFAGGRIRRRPSPRTACSRPGGRTRVSSSSCSRSNGRHITITTRCAGGARRCSAALRPGSGRHARRPGRRCPPPRTPGRSARRRRQRPDPCLPWPRPPGRGAARRDPPPARARPDARAARRDRHVPGHRDVRAAHPGHVRCRAGADDARRRADDRTDNDRDAVAAAERRARPTCTSASPTESLRQTNPLLSVVARLLELADDRVTASQLLDLADREPVRRRFRFDDDDLSRMEEWVVDSGIRWGLDARHRAPFQLDVVPQRAPGGRASTASCLGWR